MSDCCHNNVVSKKYSHFLLTTRFIVKNTAAKPVEKIVPGMDNLFYWLQESVESALMHEKEGKWGRKIKKC